MFKPTSLFIKFVWLNNTYNLSLISGSYNDFDFSFKIYVENCKILDRGGGGGAGGGASNAYRTVSYFHVFFWGHSLCIKIGHNAIEKNILFKHPILEHSYSCPSTSEVTLRDITEIGPHTSTENRCPAHVPMLIKFGIYCLIRFLIYLCMI